MINLVTFLKRTKNIDLSKLTYELFKYGLIRKIFLINGKINPLIILNYLMLSIEVETKKQIGIVEDYYGNIEPKLRKPIIKFSSAVNYFNKGNYKEALKICSGRLSDDLEFKIYQKLLLIICHCEVKNEDLVKIEKARTDLLRYAGKHQEELGLNFHKAIKNFCTAIKKITNVNINTEQLKLNIKNENYITMKKWLLRKAKNASKS